MRSRLLRTAALLLLSTLVVTLLSCSKKSGDVVDGGDDGGGDDGIPAPGEVTDLRVIDTTSVTATFHWTAPARTRPADPYITWYDLRYSATPLTELNWEIARQSDEEPPTLPTGQVQSATLTNLKPESTYYFAVKCWNSNAKTSGISNVIRVHLLPEITVLFADANLESLVRQILSRATGDIHEADVIPIPNLPANNWGIANLSGLEYFKKMQSVELNDDQVSDLTPLGSLPGLAMLHTARNHISSIAPLAGTLNLIQFVAPGNTIADLTPLAQLIKLLQIDLQQNQIQNITPLHELTALRSLYLSSNQIHDVSALHSLTALEELYLGSNTISDISPLATLVHLQRLDLPSDGITDITALSALTELNYLNLSSNQITDISALVSNTGLGSGDQVWLDSNPLSDHAQSVDIPALRARGVTVNF